VILSLKRTLRRQIIKGMPRPIKDHVRCVIENAEIEMRIARLVRSGHAYNNNEKNR
jgi:hypothetical protein